MLEIAPKSIPTQIATAPSRLDASQSKKTGQDKDGSLFIFTASD